jgi:hypothetical protein
MTKVVIDADQMVYACGFASEGEPLSHTLHLVKKAVSQIITNTKADEHFLYLSGEGNFREEIAFTKGYKATRSGRKPLAYDEIRDYMINVMGAITVNDMEADDMVSILLFEDYMKHGGDPDKCEVILSSPDKDLNNTPGWHYHPTRGGLSWVTEAQAHRHFCFQLLCGDRVDNIPGLPYCGEITRKKYSLSNVSARGCADGTAKKIMSALDKDKDPLPAIYEAYAEWAQREQQDYTYYEDYVNEQGQLLWMLRELDDFNEPVTWHPDAAQLRDAWCTIEEEIEHEKDSDDAMLGS